MKRSNALERSAASRYAGRLLILGAVALLLVGAVRRQSNMVNTGLMFLSLGLIFAPDVWRQAWPVRAGIILLVCAGVGLAIVT